MKSLEEMVDRDQEAIKCDCGGYMERGQPTEQEEKEWGCGYPMCCSRVFICCICHKRICKQAYAPDFV